jgi:hypothetical protein
LPSQQYVFKEYYRKLLSVDVGNVILMSRREAKLERTPDKTNI